MKSLFKWLWGAVRSLKPIGLHKKADIVRLASETLTAEEALRLVSRVIGADVCMQWMVIEYVSAVMNQDVKHAPEVSPPAERIAMAAARCGIGPSEVCAILLELGQASHRLQNAANLWNMCAKKNRDKAINDLDGLSW